MLYFLLSFSKEDYVLFIAFLFCITVQMISNVEFLYNDFYRRASAAEDYTARCFHFLIDTEIFTVEQGINVPQYGLS